MPQLPTVSAKVVADVEKYIADFKRASAATKTEGAGISSEVERIVEHTKRQFSGARLSHALLEGVGIGTSFALVETTIGKWKDIFNEASEGAKELDDWLKEVRNRANEISEIRFKNFIEQLAPADQVDKLKGKLAEIDAALAATKAKEGELTRDMATAGGAGYGTIAGSAFDPLHGKYGYGTMKGAGDKIAAQIGEAAKEEDALTKQRLALVKEIGAEEKKISEDKQKSADAESKSDYDRRVKSLTEGLKQQDDAFTALIKKQHDANDETEKVRKEAEALAAKYRELADPTLKFTKQMDEVNKLSADGKLSFEEQTRALAELKREMADDQSGRLDKALTGFFGDLDKQSAQELKSVKANSLEIDRIVGIAADGMANAWVDAINGVDGAWGNLGNTVVREIERMIAEILIVKPFINGLGAMMGSTGMFGALGAAFSGYGAGMAFGGMLASGGGVEPGYTYQVNENGQEFFKPNVGGTIMPVGASRGAAGGGGGGDTFSFNYNFATGVSKAELMPLLALQQRDTLAKIADAKRRRTSLGYALA